MNHRELDQNGMASPSFVRQGVGSPEGLSDLPEVTPPARPAFRLPCSRLERAACLWTDVAANLPEQSLQHHHSEGGCWNKTGQTPVCLCACSTQFLIFLLRKEEVSGNPNRQTDCRQPPKKLPVGWAILL